MNSLRTRLFIILLLSTGVIWASAIAWIYLRSKAELEHVLDTRLQEAARMVSSLVAGSKKGPLAKNSAEKFSSLEGYKHQLSCQVWSFDGTLLARSNGAPKTALSDATSGFSDRILDGEPWRVYVSEDTTMGTRVMVGDKIGLRDRLVADLITGLTAPVILIVPLFGLLIWISIGRGLRPLKSMAKSLAERHSEDMSKFDASLAPPEVQPLAEALNLLFAKVEAARQHEREFTAFAAHELRTPIAGLRMQAQIAMATEDRAIVRSALRQIVIAVDRSDRLVRQLLAIARLDAEAHDEPAVPIRLGALIESIAAETGDGASATRTEVDPQLMEKIVVAQRGNLELAFRNLQENAIQHTFPGGAIRWRACKHSARICVDDEGPGIPEEELEHVARRFFRGRHTAGLGSGLGLAIVASALREIGATFQLVNRLDKSGLRVEIDFGGSYRPVQSNNKSVAVD